MPCPLNYILPLWNSLYVSDFSICPPKNIMPLWKKFLLRRNSPVKSNSRVLACSEAYAKWAGNWQTEQSSTPGFPIWEGQARLCVATCTNSNQFPQPFFLFNLVFGFRAHLPWSQLSNRFTGVCKITSGTELKLPLSAYIGLFRVCFLAVLQ